MTWREKTLARILLIIAVMLADDEPLKKEIRMLSTHITVHAKESS